MLKPGSTVIVWGGRGRPRAGRHAPPSWTRSCSRSRTARTRAACARLDACPTPGRACRRRPTGRNAAEIRDALAAGDLEAAFLVNADPVRDFPGRPGVERGARQGEVRPRRVDVRERLDQARRRRLPGRVLRREGGHGHPPGRPPAAPASRGAPSGQVRPIWQVLVELSALLGDETGIDSAPEALAAIASEVPFYAGHHPRGDRRHGASAGRSARRHPRRFPNDAPERGRAAVHALGLRLARAEGEASGGVCSSGPTATCGRPR